MQLHILGCHGPWPIAGGAASGYLLSHNGKQVLIDCGCGVLSRLLQLTDPAGLSAILLSHLHFDHASDLLTLSYYLQKQGVRLPVYVPPEDESPLKTLLSPDVYDLQPYPEKMEIAGIAVTSFPVRHPVPCRALRLEAEGKVLVYTGDTNTCDNLAAFARDADVLLCDAAFLHSEWQEKLPHLSALKAAELAAEAQAKHLRLTHLPTTHDKKTMEDEARSLFPAVKAAVPGDVIYL
ncbi:MAG: MBL fold metallo-hydrolase [Clostridia bacterium]|nr:MBL fold metallo-hydrolase [Clostridia bacterium]